MPIGIFIVEWYYSLFDKIEPKLDCIVCDGCGLHCINVGRCVDCQLVEEVVVAGIYIHFLACNTILNNLEQVHFHQLHPGNNHYNSVKSVIQLVYIIPITGTLDLLIDCV